MKVDLHLHSNWSDGSMGIPQLVRYAKDAGIDVISITDHDTMAGQIEAQDEGAKQGQKVINGVEISAFNPETGRKVHILGYNVKNMEAVNRACLPYLEDRHRKNLESALRIIKAGYLIRIDDVTAYASLTGTVYRQHIMHALVERGYTPTIYGPLYKKLFGPDGLAFVKSSYMGVKEAVDLIRECGGHAVLAHPFQYDSVELIPRLVEWGLAGIEYQHHTQTEKHQEAISWICNRYNLFLTGGSDFHGFYSEKALLLGANGTELGLEHQLIVSEKSIPGRK